MPSSKECEDPMAVPTGKDKCSTAEGRWILAATILGSSMAFIDGTAVAIALPAIQHAFKGTVADAQWVIESYALLVASLLLLSGAAGDRFGRRRIYLIGVAVFTAASAWCGISRNIHVLIFGRAVQGFGAALLVPGSMAIITASFPEKDRGRAIGTWSAFSAITAAIGPVLGGLLVQHLSWHWIFFINIPLAVILTVIVLRWVPESRHEDKKSFLDWRGAFLATFALAGLVYGLIEASNLGWRHLAVRGSLGAGVVFLAAFLVAETRSASPMLPLSLFRSRNFSAANLQTFFLHGGLNAALIFFPFNFIQVQDYSPTAAGAAFLPLVVIMFLLSRWAGGLVRRYGSKTPLVIGPIVAAAGFGLFSLQSFHGSYWTTFFPGFVLLGLGMVVSVAPLTTTVMNALPREQAGVASGVNNAVSRLAALLAIAVYGMILVHVFGGQIDQRLSALHVPKEMVQAIKKQRSKLAGIEFSPEMTARTPLPFKEVVGDSFIAGFRRIMIVSTVLSLLSALCAWLLIE